MLTRYGQIWSITKYFSHCSEQLMFSNKILRQFRTKMKLNFTSLIIFHLPGTCWMRTSTTTACSRVLPAICPGMRFSTFLVSPNLINFRWHLNLHDGCRQWDCGSSGGIPLEWGWGWRELEVSGLPDQIRFQRLALPHTIQASANDLGLSFDKDVCPRFRICSKVSG